MNLEIVNAALERGGVVLLCGAGISVNPPATLPDWKALRDETVRAVAGSDEELLRLAGKLLNCELITVPGSRGLAPEVVASTIDSVTPAYFHALTVLRGSDPNDNHTAIARAARRGVLRHIISTNWDGLIEAALVRENVPFRVFRTNEEFAAYEGDTEPATVNLYKIHGCLTLPDSITARIEDEARGLPEPKAAVVRSLLNRFVLLLWGYSGADLKIDLDYLQMVRCQPSAPGFLWNLFADVDYRETPNQYVADLTELYGERGGVAHGILPGLLNGHLDPSEQVPLARASRDEIAALRLARTQELRASLSSWATSNLDSFGRLEAMALLLQQAGELRDAATCYERLEALANAADEAQGVGAFRVAHAGAKAMRLYLDLGELETAEYLFRRVDDKARTHGDVLLVAEAGLMLAESMRRRCDFLKALRAFGYGKILLNGAGAGTLEMDDGYELGIGDTFADVGRFDLALQRYEMVESRARRDGRLAAVASVLARRSWLSELQDDFSGAATTLRAADEIARSLGLRREHAVWSLRLWTLEGNLAELRGDESPSLPDETGLRNELRDNAVAYAREARDPLLFMQASLDAAIKRGVPVPLSAVADAERRIDEVEAFALAGRHQRLLLDAAAKRVWIRSGSGQHEATLEAVRTALERAAAFGDDGLACSLLELKADALMQMQGDANELLDCAERLAARERKRGRLYPQLETILISLRRELGIGRYPADFDDLRRALAERDPTIEPLLEMAAHSAGCASWQEWGQVLQQDHGPDWSHFLALNTLTVKCHELRQAKRPDLAIDPLRAIVDVARSWSDHQLAAVSANERGQALMELSRPEEALRAFEEAAPLAVQGKDEAELIDDWFNAAGACEELKRYDEAISYYQKVLEHPRINRDPAMALKTSLRYGEVTRLNGHAAIALTHFEVAESLVRAMNDTGRLLHLVQRLGKVHFDAGQYEPSIRYRLEAAEIFEAGAQPLGAGNMFWLVANTYLAKLGRPRDAMLYYDRAVDLCEQAQAADQLSRLRPDRDRCAEMVNAVKDHLPMMYDRLTQLCDSAAGRDRLLLRVAAGMGFNVWQFEPRSFAAYCEGQILQLPPPVDGAPPVRFPVRWPIVLSTIAGVADYENQKGNATESARLLEIAAQLARLWSLPPGIGHSRA
jgi:tetratricopeptide (TPR) repeat protein